MPQLALVIVTHNSAGWLPAFAETWRRAAEAAFISEMPVVVSDSGSQDNTLAIAEGLFPGAQTLRLANRGFGTAANLAIAQAEADWVILCNPDLTFPVAFLGQVSGLCGAAGDAVACIAPRLLHADGTVQASVGRFPTLGGMVRDQFRPRAQRKYVVPEPPAGRIDWATGACLVLRREAFEAVGGFDEKYFLYAEEVDLQRRLRDGGHEVRFHPEMAVTHHQPNALRVPRPEIQRYAARGMLRYFAKFGGGLAGYRMLGLFSGRLSAGEALASRRTILGRATGP